VGEDSDPEATEAQEDELRCEEEEFSREMEANSTTGSFNTSDMKELSSLMEDISLTEEEEAFFEKCVEESEAAIQDALGNQPLATRDTRILEADLAIQQEIMNAARPPARPTVTTTTTTSRSSQIIATVAELLAGGEEDHSMITGPGAHDIMVRMTTSSGRRIRPQARARRRWDNKELEAQREGRVGGAVGGAVGGTVQAHGRVIQGDGGYGRPQRTPTPTRPETETMEAADSQEEKAEVRDSGRNTKREEPEKAQEPTVAAGVVGGQGADEGGAQGGARGNGQGVKRKPKQSKKVGGEGASQPRITQYFPPSDKTRSDEQSQGTDDRGRIQ
jgi:hypothetical protein